MTATQSFLRAMSTIALATVAGCGGERADITGPSSGGSFSAKITGTVNKDVSGSNAFFYTDLNTDGGIPIGTEVRLFTTTKEQINFSWKGERPPTGTIARMGLGGTAPEGFFAYDPTPGSAVNDDRFFEFLDGTVTIHTSTPSRLSGTFSVRGFDLEVRGDVTVVGTFDVPCDTKGVAKRVCR
jgi:hypothetical protein